MKKTSKTFWSVKFIPRCIHDYPYAWFWSKEAAEKYADYERMYGRCESVDRHTFRNPEKIEWAEEQCENMKFWDCCF